MDLWRLNIFLKVVEHKSFSKAAQAVRLTQPTVSSHIHDIEAHYGCRLIDRMGKEALPTKPGELLFRYAKRLMALHDETENAMNDFQGKIQGKIYIGGSTIPGEYILPAMIGGFTADHPQVTVALVIGDTDDIIKRTLSGDLELGMVGAKSEEKKIIQEEIISDQLRLIVPNYHKWSDKKHIALKNLLDEPFIIREKGSGTLKTIQQSLSEKGYTRDKLNIIAEMGSTTSVIQGIKNKAGISILSTLAVEEELEAGTLKALSVEGLNLSRNFYLSLNKHRTLSPACRAFIEYIKMKLPIHHLA